MTELIRFDFIMDNGICVRFIFNIITEKLDLYLID